MILITYKCCDFLKTIRNTKTVKPVVLKNINIKMFYNYVRNV